MLEFDLPGALRRIRRRADLSQRELAVAGGISQASVAKAESARRDLPVRLLVRLAGVADLRLALLDAAGQEVPPMASDAVRDRGGRRFPAHLDTRHGDQDWWHGAERYARDQPWYTFDRLRYTRDQWRERSGTPDDHRLPQPGDSPAERLAARQRVQAERARRVAAGELRRAEPFTCTCPAACDELDDWSGRPVHADHCPCSCDMG